jgi:hypothetical protein
MNDQLTPETLKTKPPAPALPDLPILADEVVPAPAATAAQKKSPFRIGDEIRITGLDGLSYCFRIKKMRHRELIIHEVGNAR